MMLTFCGACVIKPQFEQVVYWANGKAYCSQKCFTYLEEKRFEDERKRLEAYQKFGRHKENWHV